MNIVEKDQGESNSLLRRITGIANRFSLASKTYADSNPFPENVIQNDIDRASVVVEHARTTPTENNIKRSEVVVDFLERVARISYGLSYYKNLCQQKTEEAKELKALLGTDKLTGLPNRAAFDAQLAKAVHETGKPAHPEAELKTASTAHKHRITDTDEVSNKKKFFALIMIDLDRLKSLNDDYGHPVGDAALQAFANELNKATRADATGIFGGRSSLSRLGGDEYTLIMDTVADNHEEALEIFNKGFERVRNALFAKHLHHGGKNFPLVASMGMYTIRPGDTVDIVKEEADKALYKDKEPAGKKLRYESAVKALEESGVSLAALSEKRSERVLTTNEIESIVSLLKDQGVIQIVAADQTLNQAVAELAQNKQLLNAGIVIKPPAKTEEDILNIPNLPEPGR